MKWQYYVTAYEADLCGLNIRFDKLGAAGWELVGTSHVPGSYLFKRPMPAEPLSAQPGPKQPASEADVPPDPPYPPWPGPGPRPDVKDELTFGRMFSRRADQLEVQLAGCLTAAEGGIDRPDSPSGVEAKEGDYGWSLAYAKIVQLRKDFEAAAKHAESMREKSSEYEGLIDRARDGLKMIALITEPFAVPPADNQLDIERKVLMVVHDMAMSTRRAT